MNVKDLAADLEIEAANFMPRELAHELAANASMAIAYSDATVETAIEMAVEARMSARGACDLKIDGDYLAICGALIDVALLHVAGSDEGDEGEPEYEAAPRQAQTVFA